MEDARLGSPSGTPEVTQPPRASFSPSSGGLAEINSTLRASGAQNRYGQRSGAAMRSPAAPFNFDDAFNQVASRLKMRGYSAGRAPRFRSRSASRRLAADFSNQKIDINFVPASTASLQFSSPPPSSPFSPDQAEHDDPRWQMELHSNEARARAQDSDFRDLPRAHAGLDHHQDDLRHSSSPADLTSRKLGDHSHDRLISVVCTLF